MASPMRPIISGSPPPSFVQVSPPSVVLKTPPSSEPLNMAQGVRRAVHMAAYTVAGSSGLIMRSMAPVPSFT